MDLHVDPVATTSRAVLAFCRHEGIPVVQRDVSLMKGEHLQPAFRELNPNQLVPVLVDDGFVLTESSAILRYLARKHGSALYPAGLRDAARVDECIAWFEANFFRDFGYQYVYPQVMPHHRRGSEEGTRAAVQWGRQGACRWLAVLDGHILAHGGPFLASTGLSIADFHGYSMLSLGAVVGCSYDAFPNVARWQAAMEGLESWRAVNGEFAGFARMFGGGSYVALQDGDAQPA